LMPFIKKDTALFTGRLAILNMGQSRFPFLWSRWVFNVSNSSHYNKFIALTHSIGRLLYHIRITSGQTSTWSIPPIWELSRNSKGNALDVSQSLLPGQLLTPQSIQLTPRFFAWVFSRNLKELFSFSV
jgi:hypothetical protein